MVAPYSLFEEMVLLLLIAAIAGIAAMRLRQPPIIGFIAVGVIAGPSVLNVIRSTGQIHVLAEMGLALLLFIVGLKLDLHTLRSMGTTAVAIGLAQIVLTTIGGFLLAYALGMNVVTALYVSVALTFSSTVIIVKLLSDRNQTNSLHGRIAVGLLIVQDIAVIVLMVFLSAFSAGEPEQPVYYALLIGAKGVALAAGAWILSVLIVPRLLASVVGSSEILALFGIVWALALAAAAELLGFSKEIGAFIAGVALASTPYKDALGAKLTSLRDFLLLFFFIELGSRLNAGALGSQIWSAIPLSLYVLIGNPLIMMAITGVMGYRKRTSLLAGLTVGQVSEFSLILIAIGARFGHISDDTVGLVTLVALVSIGLSTYLILYSQQIYERASPYLDVFERKRKRREDSPEVAVSDVDTGATMIIGMGSYGFGIAEQFQSKGRRVIGVDFDPLAVRQWHERGMEGVFGDARDTETAYALLLASIKWVISSIRDAETNKSLVRSLRQANYAGLIAVPAYDLIDEVELRDAGANLVFNPFSDAAVQAADLVFAMEDRIGREAMDKLIDSMSGHYIVCGYGRMGQQIVKDLSRYNVQSVVVEWNPEQLPKLCDNNIPHIEGRATEDRSLLKAGIGSAKGLIAVAASDEENVFIVLTARVLNPKLFIVARSILQENEDKLRHAGANRVMSPYVLGGRRMAAAVIKPEVMDFLDLVVHEDGGETEMAIVAVARNAKRVGKPLNEMNLWQTCGVTILAVRRNGEDLHPNPGPDFTLQEGDELIVMGTTAQINAAREMLLS